jgi:hypothetical protein
MCAPSTAPSIPGAMRRKSSEVSARGLLSHTSRESQLTPLLCTVARDRGALLR